MFARLFMFLAGAGFIVYQVLAAEDVYIAELMVESNVTLEAQTVLSALNETSELQVTVNGNSHTVILTHIELIAECIVFGDDTTCSCSQGYIWTNEICYSYNCCRETPCNQNVSFIVPLCVATTHVHINGSVELSGTTWDLAKTTELVQGFERLNGFEYLNVTGQRLSNTIADFEAAVSANFVTSKLQDIVTDLETNLNAVLFVDTVGLATIESPETAVCYESTPTLKCTYDEETESAAWNMNKEHERFKLNNGSVVTLEKCSTDEYKSCIEVKLEKVTGIWAGTYECGFTSGSVRHTAKSKLLVSLLPEEIVLTINPLVVECTSPQSSVEVEITATIQKSPENYMVLCSMPGCKEKGVFPTAYENHQAYTFTAPISCTEDPETRSATLTFENSRQQNKKATVEIPVIYAGAKSCSEEWLDGEFWPKTPYGDTVINRTCPEGRTGFKSRTCEDGTWQEVFYSCVNQELNNILSTAENFLKGLGATQEVAVDIFARLKNSSNAIDSNSVDTTADISASINILDMMANASQYIVLSDDVLDNFVQSGSNMLSSNWSGVNDSVLHHMSSRYLQSVEELVKNVRINKTDEIITPNLELKICNTNNCSMPSFDVSLNLNMSNGLIKTLAVKNLMHKLRNIFDSNDHSSLLLSATLQNNSDSSLNIVLEFPGEHPDLTERFCVFWNTTEENWSEAGCTLKTTHNPNRTFCQCNHLTSFSVLMSKGAIADPILDMITNIGLGVSVCSLLIFLTVESLVWSAVVKSNLSLFRHTALVNIAVFLLLANCCFLASTSPKSLSENWCFSLTLGKHLFYLAMFSWMLCMSVMLVHQLIFVFSPLRKRVFMFISSIVGYVCPILIVGCSYVYSKYTNSPYYNPDTCWLFYKRLLVGSMHAFLLPIGTIILTNLFSMVVVIVTLVKSSVPDNSKADDKETAKSIIKVVVFLTPVFGLTWIFGFAQLMLDSKSPMLKVVMYCFTILNSFQGLFLLITGCFAEQKVREEMLKLIKAKSQGKSESTKNLTSTMYTKDK